MFPGRVSVFFCATPVGRDKRMRIKRLINNNIVVIDDPDGADRELLVMGSGIGFKKHAGDPVDETRVEKRYRLVDASMTANLAELIENVPIEHVELADKLMRFIEHTSDKRTTGTLYISILDHVSSALQRHQRGIDIKNPMLWDIRRFYPEECALGIDLLGIIREETGMQLPEDEAGFLALHIASSQLDTPGISQIGQITDIVHAVLNIVKYRLRIEFDEKSVYYFRFVTHLKFFAQRLLTSGSHGDAPSDDSSRELLDLIRLKHQRTYDVTFNIEEYLHANYGYTMSDDERMYLTIHIARMLEVSQGKEE